MGASRSSSAAVETVDVAVLSTGEVLVGGVLDDILPAELEGQSCTSHGRKDLMFLKFRP